MHLYTPTIGGGEIRAVIRVIHAAAGVIGWTFV